MNGQDQGSRDILKKYINPGMIEKAPAGFTSKSMTRIQIETGTSSSVSRMLGKHRVALVSVILVASLILAILFLPPSLANSGGFELINNFKKLLPGFSGIDNLKFPEFEIPGWIFYASVSIFVLIFFDSLIGGKLGRGKSRI